jgi:gliding motility-associated-like protein
LLRYSLVHAQIPVIIQPDSADNYDDLNPLLICKDTFLLKGTNLSTVGGLKNWKIISGNANFLGPTDVDSVYVVFLTSNVVGIEWKIRLKTTSVYIQNQKPTPPNAGKDTILCQNSLKLSANNPTIGKGKWILPSKDISITDSTSNTALVSGLPFGQTALIWQISSVCDTLQDTLLVNNQSISGVYAGKDDSICTGFYELIGSTLLPNQKGFWYKNNLKIDSVSTSDYDGFDSGENRMTWQVIDTSSGCSASDEVIITFSLQKKAEILLPIDSVSTVCNNQILLKAPNKGGSWFRNNENTPFSDSTSVTVALLPDTNVFERFYSDPLCGNSTDKVTVIYNELTKPDLGPDLTICTDSLSLTAPANSSGYWTNLLNGDTSAFSVLKKNNLPIGTTSYTWTAKNGICTLSDTIKITRVNPEIAVIRIPSNDTIVCSNQIKLAASGFGGTWAHKNDTSFHVTSLQTSTNVLLNDTNTFYYTVSNAFCGKAIDSVRVINRSIVKPNVVLDSCFTGIPTDSLLLLPRSSFSNGTGVWSVLSSPISITLKNNLANNSAKFKSNNVGQYKFKFKVFNTTCSDSATTTFRILTKAHLEKDTCILKKRGELAIVNIKNNFPANIDRKEKGVWSRLDTNAIIGFDLTKPDLKFQALRGVYSFVYTISDTCKTCITCESKDTIIVSITNYANVLETNTCLLLDSQKVNVNILLSNEVGFWNVANTNTTGLIFKNADKDTIFTVSKLPLGRHKLYWNVSHANGCGVSKDSVTITRLTTPNAGPDKCYDVSKLSLEDTLIANALSVGENGQWKPLSPNFKFQPLINSNLCKVFRNDNGIYPLAWGITATGCSNVYWDTIKVTFLTKPRLSLDTVFNTPFIGSYAPLLSSKTLPETASKEKAFWTLPDSIHNVTNLKVPDLKPGVYNFKVTFADSSKTNPCKFVDSINVVYLTKSFINKTNDTCVKADVSNIGTISAKPISNVHETGQWYFAEPAPKNATIQSQIGANPERASITGLKDFVGKFKIYWKVTSNYANGKYSSLDSLVVTKLSKPIVSGNIKSCTDTIIALNPAVNFSKQSNEKVFWTSTSGLLKGNSAIDTLRQLPSGNYWAGLVIRDTNTTCADTAKINITKVSKAIAFNTQTLCITDTFATIKAMTKPVTGENGIWTFVSNTFSKNPSFDSSSSSQTATNGLGRRSTRLMWKIINNIDKTCFSVDTVNTRIVVVTKPKALPEDPCIEFTGQAINLKGNLSASYEISRWSILDGKLLAQSKDFAYKPDSAGYKNLVYTLIDSTNNYRCAFSDTATLQLVPKASITTQNLCNVLPKGQTKTDTLKVSVFHNVKGLSYRFNEIAIAGIPNSVQTKTYDLPDKYVNKWEMFLGANCSSKDSATTTVISKAIAGTDTCLIGADTISLKGNQPQSSSKELGKWSVLEGNSKFSDSTKYNSKVIFSAKGFTKLQWKIQNGGCADSNSIKVSSISKAVLQTPIPSCLKDIDSVQLQGNRISLNEKSIWQIFPLTKDTILKASSGKVKVAFGVNRFKYTIYDPQYPSCSDSVKVFVSVLKKPQINPDECNNYNATIVGNDYRILEPKPTISGLTYEWTKDKTLVGDTIIESNNSIKLQYNRIGRRTLWFKSFVTDNPSCRDSVLKTVQVITNIVFPIDTCITSSSFKLIPAMYPDFKSGEYLRANVGGNQFEIRRASDSIYNYPKGKNKVSLTVFDSTGTCSVSLNNSTLVLNYISEAKPSSATVCKYYDSNQVIKLTSPQALESTEKGGWRSESVEIDTVENIAKGFKKGKNVLKWVITSKLDEGCSSDSTVNFYTLTPSGFKSKDIYTCVTDTTINALKPSSIENVTWSPSSNTTKKSSTDSSISLQNLSNDIFETVIRTISLGETCPLSDTVRVFNRQLMPFKISTQGNQTGTDSVLYTCQTFINLLVPDVQKDIDSAKFSWNIIPATISRINNSVNSQFTNLISNRQYIFIGSAKNANCPYVRDTLKLFTRKGLGGIPISKSDTVCGLIDYEVKNLNINLGFIPDNALWTPIGSSLVVNLPNETNPNNVVFKNLEIQNNDLAFEVTKNGCDATMRIRIVNNQKLDTVKLGIGSFDKQVCDNSTFRLMAIKPNLSDADTIFFNYYWAEDKLGQKKIGSKNRNDTTSVTVANDGLKHPYYFVVKNGVCPQRDTVVYLQNFQQIDSISAGTNDTICATKINLQGYKNQTFAKVTWYNITNGVKDPLDSNFNPRVKLKPNILNKFLWKVTNGVCEKYDTLKILVGDSIATAKVADTLITDCGTGIVFLKGNDPSLNGGKGFWWDNSNDIFPKEYEFEHSLKPKSSKDTLKFFYTIKNDYCSTTDTTTVYYFQKPSIANAGPDQILVKKQTVMNANQPEVGIGTWILKTGTGVIENINNPNTTISDLVFGENVFIWRISNGPTCQPSEDQVVLSFSDFDIPQAFSPNGDGKNDLFEIVGLENYSGSKLKVLNRWGRQVYSTDDYKNDWDGTNLEEDTYFYILEIPGIEIKKGYIVLKRK